MNDVDYRLNVSVFHKCDYRVELRVQTAAEGFRPQRFKTQPTGRQRHKLMILKAEKQPDVFFIH